VGYQKHLWGVYICSVLSVLPEVTVGLITHHRLHVTEYIFRDVCCYLNLLIFLCIREQGRSFFCSFPLITIHGFMCTFPIPRPCTPLTFSSSLSSSQLRYIYAICQFGVGLFGFILYFKRFRSIIAGSTFLKLLFLLKTIFQAVRGCS
jgi:hypothetical protein